MTSMRSLQFMPYPELVESSASDKPYTIMDSLAVAGLPSTGMVSKTQRVMFVPFSESGASTRRHELGHVKWSPMKLPRVDYDERILLAVEDARINMALALIELEVELSPDMLARVAALAIADLEGSDVAGFVLRAIAALGTNALPSVLGALNPGPPGAGELVQLLLSGVEARLERSRSRASDSSIATFEAVRRAADYVARELKSRSLLVGHGRVLRIGLSDSGCCLSCAPPGHGVLARLLFAAKGGEDGKSSLEDINAAEMTIAEPPLPVACPRAKPRAIAVHARREGALVRNANRWFSDRAVFRGRARCAGGTVLVDTSASMKLDAAGVDRILGAAPGATLVAIYSGKDSKGELRIVARKGRRVKEDGLVPFGGGNLIDLPALKWLGAQAAPRLWLSDGRVTGVHDWASTLLARQCYTVCRRYGIRRVETAEEAAAILDGRPAPVHPVMPVA